MCDTYYVGRNKGIFDEVVCLFCLALYVCSLDLLVCFSVCFSQFLTI